MRIILLLLIGIGVASCASSNPNSTNPEEMFEAFRTKKKFVYEEGGFYPGLADESLRPDLTKFMNLAADDFEAVWKSGNASSVDYHQAMDKGLSRFKSLYNELDTEDRERVCTYFEELMDIVDLKSSAGSLNSFIYGFDPGQN